MVARWTLATLWALVVLLAGSAGRAGDPPPPRRAHGALVVAYQETARRSAKALARLVYRDGELRPPIDEAMAQVLVGKAPASPARPGAARSSVSSPPGGDRAEVAAVLRSLSAAPPPVRKRLLASLGQELGAVLVVVVTRTAAGPRARVLQVEKGRYLAVTLAARPARRGSATAPQTWDWRDALSILPGLLHGPPPGPRDVAARAAQPEAAGGEPGQEQDGEPFDLLTSPWFWGGLGVVVAVGVTVFILSQTALDNPAVVVLEGQVSP